MKNSHNITSDIKVDGSGNTVNKDSNNTKIKTKNIDNRKKFSFSFGGLAALLIGATAAGGGTVILVEKATDVDFSPQNTPSTNQSVLPNSDTIKQLQNALAQEKQKFNQAEGQIATLKQTVKDGETSITNKDITIEDQANQIATLTAENTRLRNLDTGNRSRSTGRSSFTAPKSWCLGLIEQIQFDRDNFGIDSPSTREQFREGNCEAHGLTLP